MPYGVQCPSSVPATSLTFVLPRLIVRLMSSGQEINRSHNCFSYLCRTCGVCIFLFYYLSVRVALISFISEGLIGWQAQVGVGTDHPHPLSRPPGDWALVYSFVLAFTTSPDSPLSIVVGVLCFWLLLYQTCQRNCFKVGVISSLFCIFHLKKPPI